MNGPLRILHVIGKMNRGGAETMIMNLYRHIDREKVQFDFIENTYEKTLFEDEIKELGGRVYKCPHYNGKNHFQYIKWWNDFFSKHVGEYKIIHGHLGSTASIYLSIAKKYGLVTIAHSHSAGSLKSIKDILYKIISFPTRYISNYFIGCSYEAGVSRFGRKVIENKKKYFMLQNAIDTNEFKYDANIRNIYRRKLNITNDEFVIGHVGRFTYEKNHDFILLVFKELLVEEENSKLLLIGDGPLKENVFNKAMELGIIDSVLFLGVRDDVNNLMQSMDVLFFPSLYEGLPLTLIEAQTNGLPCVISDTISKNSIICDDLFIINSLTDSILKWSESIIKQKNQNRKNNQDIIIENGFDVNQTSIWLTNFYMEVCKYEQ